MQLRTAMMTPLPARKEVPKFAAYADDFMKTYVVANNKPSERQAKASILQHHLLPACGEMLLDAIKVHAIETLKARLLAKKLSPKRVNNVLACLGKMLRYAHEIELIESAPKVKLLKLPPQKFDFLTFEELPRLLEVVKGDPERTTLFLLGAEAGLRQGELIALQWTDVDLVAQHLDGAALVLEGRGRDAEERAGAQAAAHCTVEGRAQGAATPEIRAGLLRRGWPAVHSVDDRGGASVRMQASWAPSDRLTRASAYVLLAPRDARCGTEGDPRACGSLDPEHDASLHASSAQRASRSDRTFGFWAAGGQRRSGGNANGMK